MTRRSREYALALHFRSDPKYLSQVRRQTFQLARRAGFNQVISKKISLAVDEACTNIIRHTYKGKESLPILIRGMNHLDRLEIRVRDFGEKLDLSTLPDKPSAGKRAGGMGLGLMRTIMDEIIFDTSVAMGTEVCLIKMKVPKVKPLKKVKKERSRAKAANKNKKSANKKRINKAKLKKHGSRSQKKNSKRQRR